MSEIPLSLYIHLPWCIQKCPYCDFNSHAQKGELPEQDYVRALISDLKQSAQVLPHKNLKSIFFGGGTPSLFSAASIDEILNSVRKEFLFSDIEITMEANPGTAEQQRFSDYRKIGVNRLSLGIQSFNPKHLKRLGRIHDGDEARRAIDIARVAGFDNFNLDIMFGLPDQTLEEGLDDLNIALSFEPTHFSWYELTIEPNTIFYKHPPQLPQDDIIEALQTHGQLLLAQHGLKQYEVSAYSREGCECVHNLNYWQFGDYLGIGAGAHSKISSDVIFRESRVRQPTGYMKPSLREAQRQSNPEKKETYIHDSNIANHRILTEKDLILEFMLNALRLTNGFNINLFYEHTHLPWNLIEPTLKIAIDKRWLRLHNNVLTTTDLGRRYLNDVIALFS